MKENNRSIAMNKTFLIYFMMILLVLSPLTLTAESDWEDSVFALQQAFRDVSARVLPVVVEINVVDVVQREGMGNNPFNFFFGLPFQDENPQNNQEPQEFRQEGLGSGVIVKKDGNTYYVLTNNHVAGSADEITITLYDQTSYQGEIVGTDPLRDLALLSFESELDIPVAVIGDSDNLQVGDWVLAIGNPYGFESTVTAGIVSAKGRTQSPGSQTITDYIQTDASINRGNSGGALVNLYGEVIGINTWIASQTGGSIGLGFSIPINNVKPAIDDFINNGEVQYGWLGVHMGDLSESLINEFNLEYHSGAMVYNVYQDSPAMNGGISPGDLIITVEDMEIGNSNDLTHAIANRPPGDVISVEYVRDNQSFQTHITLGLRNVDNSDEERKGLWPGFTVAPLSRELRERMDLPRNSGNIIIGYVDPDSKAGVLGLQSGDVIKSINSRNIKDIADFYEKLRDQQHLDITVIRRGYELDYQLSL